MHKLLFVIISIFYIPSQIIASQENSICQRITNCGLAFYVYTERLVKNDNDILINAASYSNVTTLKYCLDNHIGNIYARDSEGRTALETAELCCNNEAQELITKKLLYLKRKKIIHKQNDYSNDSDNDWAQESPTSITRRKKLK